jgi:hypothetical protein
LDWEEEGERGRGEKKIPLFLIVSPPFLSSKLEGDRFEVPGGTFR